MANKSHLCTLTNQELVEKADQLLIELIKTGGKSFTMQVPARPNADTDLIFAELNTRFKKLVATNDEQHQYLTHVADNGHKLYEALKEAYEELKRLYKRDGHCPSDIKSSITSALVDWEDETFVVKKVPGWVKGVKGFPTKKRVVAKFKHYDDPLREWIVGYASSATGEMICFDWNVSAITLDIKHERWDMLYWLDESPVQDNEDYKAKRAQAVALGLIEDNEGEAVFVPCAENDERVTGCYQSLDGQSLCYVRETNAFINQSK